MRDELDIKAIAGLSSPEAANRLAEEGFNELPSAGPRGMLAIAWETARQPMFLLLLAAGAVYLVLGDVQEALLLLGFVFVVIGITFYQEQKTERTLEALRDLSSPRALVIRDGQQTRIAGREVVRGDALILAEGDRVPADATVLWSVNLSADESLLSGESVPVRKVAGAQVQMARPGGDDQPFVFSGTLIVQGQGLAQVLATGSRTEIGRIGKALRSLESESTPLQRETERLVRDLAIVGLALFVLVVVVYGITRSNWLDGLLAGIAMAMAMLPEEFPVVLTVFLALGAWRISQRRVLTRHAPVVEALGSATVLCVDKTGTLTVNRMSVRQILAQHKLYDLCDYESSPLPESCHELVEFSILASQTDPFDPMEKAFRQLGEHYLDRTEHLHQTWTLVHEYPLSKTLLAMSHVWQSTDGADYVIATKGAPEAIAELCHFNEGQAQTLARQVTAMAGEGLRVIGVAKGHCRRANLPHEQHDFKFKFLGLIGLADPVRPAVAGAIKECYAAGVRVVMITGDYPGTARNIAQQIGLAGEEAAITGLDLDKMDDAELRRRVKTVNIFARVVPEQKLRLVTALRANGEIVAMTGDGVNDAPALKAAHIGIAMGGRGTDVAREAAALVLLDDDFSSIVQAVKVGRRIFDNLRKAMAYIFAIHVPIAAVSLIPVLLRWPLVLVPVHIVFLELIIDPACSIVFEAEPAETDVMNRPPRNPKEPLFGRRTIMLSLLQGLSVAVIVLAVFGISLYRGQGELEARALTFTTLVIANLSLIFANRSWSRPFLATLRSPNAALWWVTGGAVLFLGLVLYIPYLRELFRFATLHPLDLLLCLVAGVISIAWFEGLKIVKQGLGWLSW